MPTWGPRLAASLLPITSEAWLISALLDPEPDTAGASDAGRLAALAAELAPHAVEQLRDRGPLSKEDLGRGISPRVPPWAMQDCQRCGRRHPSEALMKMLVWTHRIRLEPPAESTRPRGRIAPASRWRPRRFRRTRDEDRAELVRQYLRRYAPSDPKALADWMGVAPAYAEACWRLVADELEPVNLDDGPQQWALASDLDVLADPPAPPVVRLVPPYDPLLRLRDRQTLVPDRDLRRETWRAVANPGLVLLEGQPACQRRARRRGQRLEVRISPADALNRRHLGLLEADLTAIATATGADTVDLDPAS